MEVEIHLAHGRRKLQLHLLGPGTERKRMNIIRVRLAVGQDLCPDAVHDEGRARIIHIEHRRLARLLPFVEMREEECLGFPVIFHGLVEIQVVLSDVREGCCIILDAGHAVQCKGMGRDFHDTGVTVRLHHTVERLLQVHHIRCRIVGDFLLIPDHDVDGADEPDLVARTGQEVPQDIGGRRLAVRARDADHPHLAGRIVIEPGCQFRHRPVRVIDLDFDDAGGHFHIIFHKDCRGSLAGSLPDILMAVRMDAFQADKETSRCGRTGVDGQVVNGPSPGIPRHTGARYMIDYVGQITDHLGFLLKLLAVQKEPDTAPVPCCRDGQSQKAALRLPPTYPTRAQHPAPFSFFLWRFFHAHVDVAPCCTQS